MAKLINGNGNKAIWAAQDADLIAALAGNVTGIAKVGNKFLATQEDANTIGLSDGVIVTKEGRRIQLDVGNVDLFDIPTGTVGVTSYYIIGYHLITNSDSSQTCETFVQKMDNATDVIAENTFRGGATEIYVSCYRVVQDGLNIDSINALLPELKNISTLMSDISDLTESVSVTANGVKTNKQLFNELYALVDKTKLGAKSVLSYGTVNFPVGYYDANSIVFNAATLSSANNVQITSGVLKATNSTYGVNNNGTYYNYAGNVAANGSVIKVSY